MDRPTVFKSILVEFHARNQKLATSAGTLYHSVGKEQWIFQRSRKGSGPGGSGITEGVELIC